MIPDNAHYYPLEVTMRLPFPDDSFNTIYADPPWPEYGGGKIRRGANRHYQLLSIEDIKALYLEVKRVAGVNCHLYLWTTNNYLPAALEVMERWGFSYRTVVTWAKDRFGLGQYFRGMSEHCLFGVRGNHPYRTKEDGKRAQGVTVIQAPRTEHSAKPEEMRRMIELVSPGPYLELFARPGLFTPEGWAVWGNEVAQSQSNEERVRQGLAALDRAKEVRERIFEKTGQEFDTTRPYPGEM